MKSLLLRCGALCLLVVGSADCAWAQIQFNPTFLPGSGFLDTTPAGNGQTLGEVRQETLTAVTDYLGSVLFGIIDPSTGEFISGSNSAAQAIDLTFTPSTTGLASASIGTGPSINGFDFTGGFAEILSPDAGADGAVTVNFSGNNINSTLAAPAPGEIDLFSVLLHELTHHLGIVTNIFLTDGGGISAFGPTFSNFDAFLVDADGNALVGPNEQVFGNAASVTGGADTLFFSGPNAVAANGGELVNLFSPTTFSPGSSIAHVDESFAFGFPDAVIGPSIAAGTQVREFAPVELGILQDVGFAVSLPLELAINADTGEVSISAPGDVPTTITGFSITSASGALVPENFTGSGLPGFEIANPTPDSISELNPSGEGVITDTAVPIGTLGANLDLPATPFGQPLDTSPVTDDLTFTFVTADGEITVGTVAVVGDTVANTLVLTIDPVSGQATLTNESVTTINLGGYTISSDDGSLVPEGFAGLGDPSLDVANPTEDALSELAVPGGNGLVIAGGETLSLGVIFQPGADAEGVSLEFLFDEAGLLPGDYNSDGVVDAADYTVYRDNFNADGFTLPNETVTPGEVTLEDFQVFVDNFGSELADLPVTFQSIDGVVVFDSLAPAALLVAVPEPGAATLLLASLACGVAGSRSKRSGC